MPTHIGFRRRAVVEKCPVPRPTSLRRQSDARSAPYCRESCTIGRQGSGAGLWGRSGITSSCSRTTGRKGRRSRRARAKSRRRAGSERHRAANRSRRSRTGRSHRRNGDAPVRHAGHVNHRAGTTHQALDSAEAPAKPLTCEAAQRDSCPRGQLSDRRPSAIVEPCLVGSDWPLTIRNCDDGSDHTADRCRLVLIDEKRSDVVSGVVHVPERVVHEPVHGISEGRPRSAVVTLSATTRSRR
jgi:hypothetical protein